jgi:diaminopimelate decarboxylase
MKIILGVAGLFDSLKFVDFGGGLGIAYREEEKDIDLKTFGENATRLMEEFAAKRAYVGIRDRTGTLSRCECGRCSLPFATSNIRQNLHSWAWILVSIT